MATVGKKECHRGIVGGWVGVRKEENDGGIKSHGKKKTSKKPPKSKTLRFNHGGRKNTSMYSTSYSMYTVLAKSLEALQAL